LRSAVGLDPVAGPDVAGISIDSRTLRPGDLFVALRGDPGPRFFASHRSDRDGHDFVADAIEAGAVGVLVDREVDAGVSALHVEDTLDGLWQVAAARRGKFPGKVVALTGSSGKTTLKNFLADALGAFASEGSQNNHIGVPLSLARTSVSDMPAVYELGTNHPGEIGPLSQLVTPDVAVVLNVSPAHIEYFKDTDADDKADVREVILSGFGRDNVQSVTNGLLWGLDNKIYFAAGRNPKQLTHRGKPLPAVSGVDLRFDPRTPKERARWRLRSRRLEIPIVL